MLAVSSYTRRVRLSVRRYRVLTILNILHLSFTLASVRIRDSSSFFSIRAD